MARVVGRYIGSFYTFPRNKLRNDLLAGLGIVICIVLREHGRARIVEDNAFHVWLKQRHKIRFRETVVAKRYRWLSSVDAFDVC